MNKTIMAKLGFDEQMGNIEQGLCAWCGKPLKRDDLPNEEYKVEFDISGLCKVCQDKVFGDGI